MMNRAEYLKAMGIQSWKQRAVVCTEVSSESVVEHAEIEPQLEDLKLKKADGQQADEQAIKPVLEVEPQAAKPLYSEPDQSNKLQNDQSNTLNEDIESYGWEDLSKSLTESTTCESCAESGFVFGDGDLTPQWLFISDAPNQEELNQQTLFSGRAGQLYEAILQTLSLQRSQVYTTSFFKCPASNSELLTSNCASVLARQITLLKPKVIITLGEFVAQSLLNNHLPLSTLREQNYDYKGAPVITTFHPRQILEQPSLKEQVWKDLKRAYQLLEKAQTKLL